MVMPEKNRDEDRADAAEDNLEFEHVYGFRAMKNGQMDRGW